MAAVIKKPFVLALLGTSLTSGRLATPDNQWDRQLFNQMRNSPEAKGPIEILPLGKGSQTSDWGVTQAPLIRDLRPSHVLMEDFGINDCAMGVSEAQAMTNFDTMVTIMRTGNAGVVIAHQTMSPASAADTFRVNLFNYYNNGKSRALANGMISLDHYAVWPKPLDPVLTVGGDGLHPLWADAFALYSFPAILTWARARMAEYWP